MGRFGSSAVVVVSLVGLLATALAHVVVEQQIDDTGGSVAALAIDPKTPTTLYAGTGAGIGKSTDGGARWTACNAGFLTSAEISALAIDPINPQTLYVGTDQGIFKSTNNGKSWGAVNTGLTEPGVEALAIDPSQPATLYTGTSSGIFKSTNGGKSWSGFR